MRSEVGGSPATCYTAVPNCTSSAASPYSNVRSITYRSCRSFFRLTSSRWQYTSIRTTSSSGAIVPDAEKMDAVSGTGGRAFSSRRELREDLDETVPRSSSPEGRAGDVTRSGLGEGRVVWKVVSVGERSKTTGRPRASSPSANSACLAAENAQSVRHSPRASPEPLGAGHCSSSVEGPGDSRVKTLVATVTVEEGAETGGSSKREAARCVRSDDDAEEVEGKRKAENDGFSESGRGAKSGSVMGKVASSERCEAGEAGAEGERSAPEIARPSRRSERGVFSGDEMGEKYEAGSGRVSYAGLTGVSRSSSGSEARE